MKDRAGSGTHPPPWLALPALAAAAPSVALAWGITAIPVWAAAAGALVAAGTAVATLIWGERGSRRTRGHLQSLRSEVDALERKIREQADALNAARTIDDSTGVLKRAAFLQRFEETMARDARLETPIALLLMDIEGFPKICSEHGRDVGEDALRVVARAISGATRGTDIAGRLGEGQLGVVLAECSDARPAMDRLMVALDGLTVAKGTIRVRPIIGAVLVEDPQEGWHVSETIREAEATLTALHGRGGGSCQIRRLRREPVRTVLG